MCLPSVVSGVHCVSVSVAGNPAGARAPSMEVCGRRLMIVFMVIEVLKNFGAKVVMEMDGGVLKMVGGGCGD